MKEKVKNEYQLLIEDNSRGQSAAYNRENSSEIY